jgi:hypothetical protein
LSTKFMTQMNKVRISQPAGYGPRSWLRDFPQNWWVPLDLAILVSTVQQGLGRAPRFLGAGRLTRPMSQGTSAPAPPAQTITGET